MSKVSSKSATRDDLPPAHLTIRSPLLIQKLITATSVISPGMETSVHLSETCDEDLPRLITHVLTTYTTETDIEHTEAIHQALADRALLPDTHLMDAGYVDAG
jgi:transposase